MSPRIEEVRLKPDATYVGSVVRLKPDATYEFDLTDASESDVASGFSRTFPSGVASGFSRTVSTIAGGVSSTSSIRFHDAMPRCSMLVTQPNAIIGQLSIVRYELNATNWPRVMRPRITSRLPSHSTTSAPRPRKNAMLGKKNPCTTISLRFRARY